MSKNYLDKHGLQLVWDAIKEKFKNLADNKSTIYLDDKDQLSIKGYAEARQGQMLVKDETTGLVWKDPVSDTTLQQYVSQAQEYAGKSSTYAIQSGNSAIDADTSAKQAKAINTQTMNWVNNKFWWGTLEEYNQLQELDEGTFYFVQLD